MKRLVIAGNVAGVPAPDVATRIRELARRLESVADGLGTQTSRSDLDSVIADLRILVIREFGRKPRAARGQGARQAILAHLKSNVGEWLDGEELAAVSGIGEWARRVRELRVQEGYDIAERDERYLLSDVQPDEAAAARWKKMNAIRRTSGGAPGRIKAFLRAYVGEVVTRDDIDYVAKIKEGVRRARELRDEMGWPLESHIEDPLLKPGEYRLVSVDEVDLMDPRQRLYPENLRARVFERENFTCQRCGQNRARADAAGDRRFYLEVHHRNAVAEQLDALPVEQLNDESNLVTYCHRCHLRETTEFQARRRDERRRR
ncbi:HNH endonuclease [Mycobacterium sp. E2238]|uniref:HNH endonuclease n=1 Tax=Mycobacterium sp. E2238 TaxID=1834131 RepID=UPI000AC4A9CF|nr:HNH endonuclease signature motif containing protein [Mycobacterium sp. E2238]